MTEIAPGIRVVLAPDPGPMTLDGTNTWILGSRHWGAGRSIVIDPGPSDEDHLRRVREEAGEARRHRPDRPTPRPQRRARAFRGADRERRPGGRPGVRDLDRRGDGRLDDGLELEW